MSVHPSSDADAVPLPTPLVTEDQDDEIPASYYYEERACYAFSKESGFRATMIKMYEHPKFDQVVLTVIGLNCITLAMYDPTDPDCDKTKCQVLAYFDMLFSLFFLLEMLVKMLAMGVCGEHAYFSTAWNKFDCFIVATSIVDFVGVSLTYLKVFRALRPLRAVNKFPKLKILVKLLLDTIPMMASVGLLCFFIFSIYGILALQLWPGITHQRCYAQQYPTSGIDYYGYDDDPDGGYICSSDDLDQGGYNACPATHPYCLRGADMSHDYLMYVDEASNPFYGAISYDTIYYCWIVIFQIITMEGWVDQMYIVQGGYSFFAGAIYFCSLIVIGAFFSINLALVVIATQFGASKDDAALEIKQDEEKEKRQAAKAKAKAAAEGKDVQMSTWEYITGFHCCKKTVEEKKVILDARLQNIQQLISAMAPEDALYASSVDGLDQIKEQMKIKEKSGKAGRNITAHGVDLALDSPKLECECMQEGSASHCRYKMRTLIETPNCENVIMACIGANVAMFATEYHGMSDTQEDILNGLNIMFCIIFGIEAVYKLIAYLPHGYFRVPFNVFDFTIVVIAFVEVGTGGGGGLSFLRMFRLVRLFRLVRFLPGLQFQLLVMLQTLGSVFSFLLLLALFIFIYAILGMFIFGNNLTFDGELDRKNFDTLFWGLITIFQVLTLEDWNAAMYAGVRYGGSWAAVYYITLIVLGNYIMFNLFVAILIDGFGGEIEEEDDDDEEEEDVDGGNSPAAVAPVTKSEAKQLLAAVASNHTLKPSSRAVSRNVSRRNTENHVEHFEEEVATTGASSHSPGAGTSQGSGTGAGTGTIVPLDSVDKPAEGEIAPEQSPVTSMVNPIENTPTGESYMKYLKEDSGATAEEDVTSEQETTVDEEPNANVTVSWKAKCFPNLYHRDHAMFCFPPESKFRIQMIRIVAHPVFDRVVIGLILLNSCCMAIESPDLDDDGAVRSFLDWSNDIFCFIFLGEMLMKWVALGVYIAPGVYFDDGWNRLDGFIVTVSLLDFIMGKIGVSGGMLSLLKICRMFRALRPLRAINKLPNLKRVVDTLIMALDPIGTTLIIIFAFFFIFGILGTQIFMGQFYFCDLADGSGACEAPRTFCTIKTKAECEAGGNAWRNQQYNFDNIGRAFMTLFVLSSIDGWVDIMYNGVDIAGVNEQPIRNNKSYLALFFVIFLLIGGFFIINMFVGVIVDNFQKNGKKPALTEEQQAMADEEAADKKYALEHENDYTFEYPPWRMKLWNFALGQPFELFIAAIIVMNVLTMAFEHYDMSDGFKLFLRITNYLFTGIFVFEMVVKQIAMGLKEYHCGLRKAWNNFDVFIVFISVLGILIDDVIGSDNVPIDPSMLKVLRILRVARILKLLKNAKDLVVLLTVVAQSLAQVGNLALLLFLLFFIYAALGIELFGKICTDDALTECNSIGSFAHFRNFGMALLVLFRLSTGDNWNGIMKDAMLEPPYCDDSGEDCTKNCCANTVIAPLYFTSFCLVSTFVMLNLVIAVLMAELEDAGSEEEAEEPTAEEQLAIKCDHVPTEDPPMTESATAMLPDNKDNVVLKTEGKNLPGEKDDVEETTETLERQVKEALQREPEKEHDNKIENLEAELEEIVSYHPPLGTLAPISGSSPPQPATPGRPSHFVPFAPGLVASDEAEDPPQP